MGHSRISPTTCWYFNNSNSGGACINITQIVSRVRGGRFTTGICRQARQAKQASTRTSTDH
jgi:hypothetical protein